MSSSPLVASPGSPPASVEQLFEFSLLGMVASGYLAVAGSGYLDLPTVALTVAALLLRFLIILGVVRLRLTNTVVNAVTLAYVGFYPLDYLFISRDFLPATVHLVFFLAIAKILTARTDRDYAYLKLIAFLELLAASLLSANLNFFLCLALFLVFAVATFSASEVRRSASGPVRVVRAGQRRIPLRLSLMTLFITGGVLSMTFGLFFFLPRTARAAFGHLISQRYRLPGFSNEITLGQLGEIKLQSTPVMHVRFIHPETPLNLKWRGMALGQFDGRSWYNRSSVKEERLQVQPGGLVPLVDEVRRPSRRIERLEYEVHIKDIDSDTLFFAGVPEFININAPMIKRLPGGSYRLPFGSGSDLSYVGYSYVERPGVESEVEVVPMPAALRLEYLELPRIDSRIPKLAADWVSGSKDPETEANAVERHLRKDYSYSLKLLQSEVRDPLAYFLFDRKAGHCEYFASAMAVMLRTLGIPSRVVTGFQSGIYNPISGWQVIRTSDAHSWVEAFLPRRGWTTYDPTPPDPNALQIGLMTRFGFYLDAAQTFWQEWVLNYDLDHQLVLATRVQQSSRAANWIDSVNAGFQDARVRATTFLKRFGAPAAAVLIAAALVIIYGPALRKMWTTRQRLKRVQRGQVEQSDASLLYSRMLRILERKGIEKPAWVTANEFVRLMPASDLSPIVEDATALYYDLRFGGKCDAGPRMLALLEQLERA
jgi:transglutaminase-like putative cysteine protease